MKTFNVYTGDGNFGCSFDHQIEADDMDGAVAVYMEGVKPEHRDLFQEEGEEDCALLTIYSIEDEEGNELRAYNGGAYFCAEIRPEKGDPRHR